MNLEGERGDDPEAPPATAASPEEVGVARLEVSDTDPRALVVPQTVEPEHLGGRGLRLVADLSRSWGVQRGARGKTVWCEGNYEVYEKQRHERLGIDADQPHRIRYKKLHS